MFELPVRPTLANLKPAIVVDESNHVAYFHRSALEPNVTGRVLVVEARFTFRLRARQHER